VDYKAPLTESYTVILTVGDIIIIIFIRHNMTKQQGTECTNSSPTMCNKIKDIKTLYT